MCSALAYIDTEYDLPVLQQAVHELLEVEMGTFPPRNYLKEKGLAPHETKFKPGSILAAEYSRKCQDLPMSDLDTARYSLQPPPADKQNDKAAWQAAIRNAKAQLQHQLNRQLNLELLNNYGGNAWLHHNQVHVHLIFGYKMFGAIWTWATCLVCIPNVSG